MSDPHNRHLLNNLASAPGTRYLEVGTFRGSTLIASLCGNEANVACHAYIKGGYSSVHV